MTNGRISSSAPSKVRDGQAAPAAFPLGGTSAGPVAARKYGSEVYHSQNSRLFYLKVTETEQHGESCECKSMAGIFSANSLIRP
jgi:hypothetical protein